MSEIGLALKHDLPKVSEILCSYSDVAPYAGDGKIFQMVGDDHGLFILGDLSLTSWYPTQRSPEIHPIRMTILGDQNDQFQLNPYPYFIKSTNFTDPDS